ncbi:IGF-like family receptor 1 isoform X2 [Myripristis murdjan]|uniref:IGF-like family receptor 1 isoform X2 n=1 Tax=Myripristis murdjan TaxID=586833 RepID=UPI0011763D3B|nr:IGF-like family receptor 1 isoform X2 [Myripristis murdjan]
MMGYSAKCLDLTKYLDRGECVDCQMKWIKPGYEFSPNCGFSDTDGRRERPIRECPPAHYNNGTFKKCQPCTACGAGYETESACNSTSDTVCRPQTTTRTPTTTSISPVSMTVSTVQPQPVPTQGFIREDTLWRVGLPFVILACVMLVALFIFICRRRKRDSHKISTEALSPSNEDFAVLWQPESKGLEHILSPGVYSAPLQTVLDNLDVLEELVILLDPEVQSVKNTRHLASRCSYSSSWITYTYSMKDKSPLKAMLEGVTTKHPEWTVGHLAKLLRDIDRNDAIAVLAKLKVKNEVV